MHPFFGELGGVRESETEIESERERERESEREQARARERERERESEREGVGVRMQGLVGLKIDEHGSATTCRAHRSLLWRLIFPVNPVL